ncbi:MAG: hypothetical protein WBL57_00940 [Methylovirgula sp.]
MPSKASYPEQPLRDEALDIEQQSESQLKDNVAARAFTPAPKMTMQVAIAKLLTTKS